MRSILFAVILAVSSTTIGCDASKRMEDIGFKQGDNPLEKGTMKYDTLIDKDEACNRAWSDYESNLQRRADMIPQLVSVVRASAKHEEKTLKEVTEARAAATQMKIDPSAGDFENPEKMAEFAKTQNTLGTAMSRLLVANEKYPELQANKAFANLQVQIEGTENRLLRAREQYNKAVADFNKELRHVSGKVINPVTGYEFRPRAYFKVAPGAEKAPVIDFSEPKAANGGN